MAEENIYDIHKLLYQNLKLLDIVVPMNSDLSQLCKERMFEVTNIKGFFEVMHYLLNIIDPKYFLENFTWPCANRRDEIKFKVNVLKYVDVLNEKANDGIIHSLKQSQMVAPGGPEITAFVWRFSMYAIKVLLERDFETSVNYINFTELDPAIIPARIKVVYQLPYINLGKNMYKSHQEHKLYVTKSEKKFRDMEFELMRIENEVKTEQQKLQTLIEDSKFDEAIKRKLAAGRISEAITEINKNSMAEINNLEETVSAINDFRTSTHICYEIVKEITDPNERVVLDGRNLKLTLPVSLKNEMILQSNGELVLEDIFKLGNIVAKVLEPFLANLNTKSMLQYLNSMQNILIEIKTDTVGCSNATSKLFELSSKLSRSITEHKCNLAQKSEDIIDSNALNLVASSVQSPQFIAKPSSTEESEIFHQGKGLAVESLMKLAESKSQVKSSTCQSVSFLKTPKQISINESASETKNRLDIKNNESVKKGASSKSRRDSLIPTMFEQKSYSSCNHRSIFDIKEEECEALNGTPKRVKKTKVLNKKVAVKNFTPQRINTRSRPTNGSPLIPKRQPAKTLQFVNNTSRPTDINIPGASAPPEYEMDNSNDSLQLDDIEFPDNLSLITMSPNSTPGTPVASAMSSTIKDDDCCQSPSGVLKRQQFPTDKNTGDNASTSVRKMRPSLEQIINRFQEIKSKSNSGL